MEEQALYSHINYALALLFGARLLGLWAAAQLWSAYKTLLLHRIKHTKL